MKPRSQRLPALAGGLTSKGLAKISLASHPRQGLELFGVLPGEEIEIQLGQRRNLWLQQVIQPHPLRREPACLHFGPCGGCSLQHLDPQAQLPSKWAPLAQQLQQLWPQAQLWQPLPSPQSYYYRTKVELTFHRQWLGFHRRGCFDRVVDVEQCLIAPPILGPVLQQTRTWQSQQGLVGWDSRQHQGDLRFLLVRQTNPGPDWLAVLVTSPSVSPEATQAWAERLRPLGPRGLIWVQQESPAAAVVPGPQQLLWGQDRLEQSLGGLRFDLHWRSFFQSNPPAYLRLLDTLKSWLGPTTSLLDLYCGIGSIGLYLAAPDTRLVGVENVAEAIADARSTALRLGRTSDQFLVQAAEDWDDFHFEAVILDPPRGGIHPRLLQRLVERGPSRIFYISCNPQRFCQEAASLTQAYAMTQAVACDFFPQTGHIELLAELRRL